MLPEVIMSDRPEDLIEIPIKMVGGDDGRFDANDYILFYGEGPDKWIYLPEENRFHLEKHHYSTYNYYFLKVDVDTGLRIGNRPTEPVIAYQTYSYNDHMHYEEDKYNLLHFANNVNLQGSGRKWFGPYFKSERRINFNSYFNLDGLESGSPIHVKMEFAGRSDVQSSVRFTLGGNIITADIPRTSIGNIEAPYARSASINEWVSQPLSNSSVEVFYPEVGGSSNNEGWLEYITLNFRRALVYKGEQLLFSDMEALQYPSVSYTISNSGPNVSIWDISDPLFPVEQGFDFGANSNVVFGINNNGLHRFIMFSGQNLITPLAVGKIENQNLHGLSDIQYLIVYHPKFQEAAQKLSSHRKTHSNLNVGVVSVDQIFHEFSSGKTDPTAIRDLCRLLYIRSSDFRYVLLLGDGSFDYKHVYKDLNNESLIPVYETEESFDPIRSYPTDDYYALLSDNEGGSLRGALDIAVGRFPVRTESEALLMVNKLIDYETGEKSLGDWRINVLFVADDEDGNRHFRNADAITEDISEKHPHFNINKIYLDAYEQENTPGGIFNPKARDAINQHLFKGQLVVNYLGHGGSNGWAHERVLQHEDVDKWNNYERLPLLITATCSFAGYDDPRKITAGEYTLIHPNGGAIALFTTVRAVFAHSNERLTNAVFNHIFEPVGGSIPPIGDILVNAKNSNSADTLGDNARKFTLLGDPAMRLAIPEYQIVTKRINGKNIAESNPDTLKALSKFKIEGEVRDHTGSLVTQFNGKLYPTIYDKKIVLKTLGQDRGSLVEEFALQKNVIFKGLASVQNGRFSFSLVVPKDINYLFGQGKISYYAEDGSQLDGTGQFSDIIIGGTDPGSIQDKDGPEIEIFLNDEDFVYGGITGPSPLLIINLSDENGINVSGNSIGHDLIGILDNNYSNTFVLNEFYESALDDYSRGKVIYPLNRLEPGKHQIVIKAWDVANNSSESLMEFLVVEEEGAGLRHVLNFPNPFSTNTVFQFEHPLQNQDIDIRIDIFSLSGRLVKTLFETVKASGNLSRDVRWDGRDEYGDPMANGIYIYRVKVTAQGPGGALAVTESDLQKLVILR